MISYLFFVYIAFIVFIIIKNNKSKNVIWLCIMITGFCLGIFGLASYNEYIYESMCYTSSKMFHSMSWLIVRVNYYLRLDILSDYRIMNVGVALYILGAVGFPLSYLENKKIKRLCITIMVIISSALVIAYEPKFLSWLMGLNNLDYFTSLYKQKDLSLMNDLFNVLIKLSSLTSIGILFYDYRKVIPILRRKFVYMFIGIAPVHVTFSILFLWFPNHKILVSRYIQLTNFSLTYNDSLYRFITYLGFVSIVLVIYAMFKYNIFETSIRKNQVSFQNKLNTAQIGLTVFSHSIKNHLIAIKLLTEQLKLATEEEKRNKLTEEIISICSSSIDKLSLSSQKIGKVELNYEIVNMNELISNKIDKYKEIYKNSEFSFESKNEIYLNIDKNQFEKVMDNLILNAIEASKKAKNSELTIVVEEKYDYGIISVSDNGIGIEEKNTKKIFDPFFSTKPMSSNWGIGLSFCQKIIEAFGGVILVHSKLHEGTQFTIYIPATASAARR
jgi:signal transduction histidine kinase